MTGRRNFLSPERTLTSRAVKLLQGFFSIVALVGLGAAPAAAETARSVVSIKLTQNDYGGGRIYVPVRFGNVIGSMRLDTGASATRITLAPWNKNFPSLGQSGSTGASGRTTSCEDVEASKVELKVEQGANIGRAKYVVARCPASDGDDLLGLDFFKGARLSLDFDRKELVFFGEKGASGPAAAFQLLGPDQRLVGVDLRLGDVAAIGLLDTGAEISAVDRQFVAMHKKMFTLVKVKGKATEAAGKDLAAKIYKIKQIDLGGGRVLRDVYALVYDFGFLREVLGARTPLILGDNVIGRFNWELDFTSAPPGWAAKAR
jgi:hypothetical protein